MRVFRWAETNAVVRRGARTWGPFNVALIGRDQLQGLAAKLLRNEARMAPFAPAFDVRETKDAYVFKGDVPGFHEKDLEICMSGHELIISGRREPDPMQDAEAYHFAERAHGAFTRTFTLPEQINHDQIQAELREGVLTIQIAKTTAPQKISVRAAERREATA